MDADAVQLPPWRTRLWVVAGFLLVALAVFAPALRGEFVRWDDDLLIFENPVVQQLTPRTLWRIFTMYDPELYIPLTFLSYQINHLIGGLDPFVYHLTSILLHGANAALVAGIAFFLSRGRREAALICGLLFAVHPLHTEAAAWIAARKDVLSAFFFLLAFLLFLVKQEHDPGRLSRGSMVAFLCALLSKVMAVTLPIVLLLVLWMREGRIRRAHVRIVAPYLGLSAVFGIVAFFGKEGQVNVLQFSETLLMAAKSTAFYLQKLVAPMPLSVIYPFDGAIALANPAILLPCAALALLLIGCVIALRRSRLPLFCALFFVTAVAPAFVNYRKGFDAGDVYFASDRYAYLASIAVLLPAALLLARLLRRSRTLGILVCATIAVTFATLSFRQAQVWRSSVALFTHAIELYPTAQAARNNLGMVYYFQGDLPRAEEEFHTAIAIRPLASTYSNLATVYRRQGKLDEAFRTFQRALALHPREFDAHFGLGLLYAQAGKLAEAEAAYKEAIGIEPENAQAYLNLGALYAQAGKLPEAVAAYEDALERNPVYANAYFNLGAALRKLGRTEEAREALRNALRIRPDMEPARQLLEQL